jgi:hypothetical protein
LLVIPNCSAARSVALVSKAAFEGTDLTLGLLIGSLVLFLKKQYHIKIAKEIWNRMISRRRRKRVAWML